MYVFKVIEFNGKLCFMKVHKEMAELPYLVNLKNTHSILWGTRVLMAYLSKPNPFIFYWASSCQISAWSTIPLFFNSPYSYKVTCLGLSSTFCTTHFLCSLVSFFALKLNICVFNESKYLPSFLPFFYFPFPSRLATYLFSLLENFILVSRAVQLQSRGAG